MAPVSTPSRDGVGGVPEVGDHIRDQGIRDLFREFRFDLVNHHAAQIDVRRSVEDPVADADLDAAFDEYLLVRDAWLQQRAYKISGESVTPDYDALFSLLINQNTDTHWFANDQFDSPVYMIWVCIYWFSQCLAGFAAGHVLDRLLQSQGK